MELSIKSAPMGKGLEDFLCVVDRIYAGDKHYVRPLDLMVKDRLNPMKNPFFQHGEGLLFTAHRHGKCVGRVTAQVNRAHLDRYQDDTGFFGFFDTVEDDEVAHALLDQATAWLEAKGMRRVRGPISLSIKEEVGCLVEGFDSPPYVMMPHHRPYQGSLIESAGFSKEKDLYSWKYQVDEVNARTRGAHAQMSALPQMHCRAVDPGNLDRDVELVADIFNDAWSDNWGFLPLTRGELLKKARDLRLILIPDLTRIVSIEGEPAAVAIALPNINEMIGDLKGKLLPFGLPKLWWRLKMRGPRSGRLVILGIRKKYRTLRQYKALSAYLYAEMNQAGIKLGIKEGELGWTLEDNGPVNAGIRRMGGSIYRKYRVYEKLI